MEINVNISFISSFSPFFLVLKHDFPDALILLVSQLQTQQVPLVVGNDAVPPVSLVRNLGIYVDADLSMRTHVLKTTSGCFAVLRRIKSIRQSVSVTVH